MARLEPLPPLFFRRPADVVAPDLLGRLVVRELDGERLVLRVVEVEAYLGACDRASHAWADRRTARTASLFRDGGSAYVYFIYGVHHMFNVVTGRADDGSAVLIRAGEPVEGETSMARLRGLKGPRRPGDVAGGPGKLCQALAIDTRLDRVGLQSGSLRLAAGSALPAAQVALGPRIGIDYAGEAASWPLRFAVAGNPHVSRPAPAVGAQLR